MNVKSREAAEEVLGQMRAWLRISSQTYKPAVMLFALRSPPEKLIEALWAAQSRCPKGDLASFKYFCGVCHSMRRELSGDLARN